MERRHLALLVSVWFSQLMLAIAESPCVVTDASGLTVEGLYHQSEYNGNYHRGHDNLTLNGKPTFWQNPNNPEGTCGHPLALGDAGQHEDQTSRGKIKALQVGDCTANTWLALPSGKADSAACFEACEAAHVNGCCRWAPGSNSEGSCAIGSGRTNYKEGVQGSDSGGFASAAEASLITRCAGRPFIFFCPAASNWNMAPPSAWDVIDNGGCYDVQQRSYYHSVVVGTGDLALGFTEEWAWKNTYGHYTKLHAPVKLKCTQSNGTLSKDHLTPANAPVKGDSTFMSTRPGPGLTDVSRCRITTVYFAVLLTVAFPFLSSTIEK